MGISPFTKRCSTAQPPLVERVKQKVLGAFGAPEQPDPSKFEIQDVTQVGNYCVVDVRYPNATNYEGRKLIVMEGVAAQIRQLKRLDPHFSPDGRGPIARFEPTTRGRYLALATAARLADL